MKRELTCIVCPIGCQLSVTLENGIVTEVTGNTCPRGKQYAIDECTNPVRTITTTARTSNGGVIPVKTAQPIPKDLMFECMKAIDNAIVALPAHIGDVVIENLLNTGVDVVVTANMK
jgi:CxxC motif-containing protein